MSHDDLMQIVRIEAEQRQFLWEAVAVRLGHDDEEPWHIFVSHERTAKWLTPVEVLDLPRELDIPDNEERLARLIEVYGANWNDVMDDPLEVVGLQHMALEGLNRTILRDLDSTPLDELAEWREQMEDVTEAEAFIARMTGSDPRAVRN
jgi:hypothetical protein